MDNFEGEMLARSSVHAKGMPRNFKSIYLLLFSCIVLQVLLFPTEVHAQEPSKDYLNQQLLNIKSIAPVSISAGIHRTSTPYECSRFLDPFADTLLAELSKSEQIQILTVQEILSNDFYRSIDGKIPEDKVSTHNLKDLYDLKSEEIERLRDELNVDALLFTSVEFSVVEIPEEFPVSLEHRLKIRVIGKLVSTNMTEPLWTYDERGYFDFNRSILVGLKGVIYISPSEKEWKKIMEAERDKFEEYGKKMGATYAKNIDHAFSVAAEKSSPTLIEIARSGKWGKLGEFAVAWAAFKLWVLSWIPVAIFGLIFEWTKERESDTFWGGTIRGTINILFVLPTLLSMGVWLLCFYYLLRALF